jgi:hypothetical protein
MCVKPELSFLHRFVSQFTDGNKDVNLKMTSFWVIVPCCLVEADRRFRNAYCLHRGMMEAVRTSDVGILKWDYTQKAAIFILTTVRTRNLTKLRTFYKLRLIILIFDEKLSGYVDSRLVLGLFKYAFSITAVALADRTA